MTSHIVLDALCAFSSVNIRAYVIDDESSIVEFDHAKVSNEHKYLVEFANILCDYHALTNDDINFRFVFDRERSREISRIADSFKTFVNDRLEDENASFKKENHSDMFVTMNQFVDVYDDTLEYSIDENDMLVQMFY
jgi:hypothetical protein